MGNGGRGQSQTKARKNAETQERMCNAAYFRWQKGNRVERVQAALTSAAASNSEFSGHNETCTISSSQNKPLVAIYTSAACRRQKELTPCPGPNPFQVLANQLPLLARCLQMTTPPLHAQGLVGSGGGGRESLHWGWDTRDSPPPSPKNPHPF